MPSMRYLGVAVAAAALWTGSCRAEGKISFATPPGLCSATATNETYDYIIVGSGAGGLPLADRLTEAGHSVLLIEKGPASTGRWNGTMKAPWLEDTGLTRFDVPGLSNQIWVDPAGISCADIAHMAGCVLGGGVAVNSGLWWKPHPADWDANWPEGWRSADVAAATDRVFAKIPGTTTPSTDGKLYLQEGFEMLSQGLRANGWKFIVPNEHPDQKNWTFGHATLMTSGGERGGPLATYLVEASKRERFSLWLDTTVRRVIREGSHATGVQIDCGPDAVDQTGRVSVTPGTGRVILSAGTFGSAKLLFRSGIGPTDMLKVINSSTDGRTMISSDAWIDLPVGYNLGDHVGTDIEVAHPDVVFYDFYGAWDNPIPKDKDLYLRPIVSTPPELFLGKPLTPRKFWEIIRGADGIDRHLHWQSRVEGSKNTSMTITQYLGTGSQSRGRLTINRMLNMQASTPPYLRDAGDTAAVVAGLARVQRYFAAIPDLTWVRPGPNETAAHYVNSIPTTPARRTANHWIGSCKLGADDGRRQRGTAVVDADARVYGMDNLFIVDGSIFPGIMTGNPSAMIVIAAEHAAKRILALPFPEPV